MDVTLANFQWIDRLIWMTWSVSWGSGGGSGSGTSTGGGGGDGTFTPVNPHTGPDTNPHTGAPWNPQHPAPRPHGPHNPSNPSATPGATAAATAAAAAAAQLQAQQAYWDKYHNYINTMYKGGIDGQVAHTAYNQLNHILNARQDVLNLRAQLLQENRWALSSTGLHLGQIAALINAIADRTITILGYAPGAQAPGIITRYTYQVLLNAFKKWSFNNQVVIEATHEQILNDAIEFTGPVATFVNSLFKLAVSIADITITMPQEQAQLKAEITRQLNALDRELEKYNRQLSQSKRLMELKKLLHQVTFDYLSYHKIPRPGTKAFKKLSINEAVLTTEEVTAKSELIQANNEAVKISSYDSNTSTLKVDKLLLVGAGVLIGVIGMVALTRK